VLLVGLTGGIGAGKSTVARMLAERGALVIDADDLAREAIEPGTAGFDAVVDAFGGEVVSPNGEIDREALAARVFKDPEARRRLEAIIHPEVARLFVQASEPYRDSDRILVYVVPLLVEAGLESMFDVVVAVTAPVEVRVARVMPDREMSEEAARDRVAAQLPDEERERVANVVLPNEGTLDELRGKVDDLWAQLRVEDSLSD
jgi:dephospho-CoA kinase